MREKAKEGRQVIYYSTGKIIPNIVSLIKTVIWKSSRENLVIEKVIVCRFVL